MPENPTMREQLQRSISVCKQRRYYIDHRLQQTAKRKRHEKDEEGGGISGRAPSGHFTGNKAPKHSVFAVPAPIGAASGTFTSEGGKTPTEISAKESAGEQGLNTLVSLGTTEQVTIATTAVQLSVVGVLPESAGSPLSLNTAANTEKKSLSCDYRACEERGPVAHDPCTSCSTLPTLYYNISSL